MHEHALLPFLLVPPSSSDLKEIPFGIKCTTESMRARGVSTDARLKIRRIERDAFREIFRRVRICSSLFGAFSNTSDELVFNTSS